MQYNQNYKGGVAVNNGHIGPNVRPKYGLKEAFNARMVASLKAEERLRRWNFVYVFANFTLLVIAIALAVIAFYLRDYWNQYNPFLEVYTGTMYLALQGLTAVVCLCAVLSWSPLYIHYSAVIVYGFIIFTIQMVQLLLLLYTLFAAAAANLNTVSETFKDGLQNYTVDKQMNEAINYVQENLFCCGADDMADWFDTVTNALPYSCCSQRPSGGEHNCLVTDMLYVQMDSCLPKLKEIPSDGLTIIYAVTGSILIIEMAVFLLTMRVAILMHKQRPKTKTNNHHRQ